MDQAHFKHLDATMRDTIIPNVKKFIRLTIRENAGKEKDCKTNLAVLLDDLESQYISQCKFIFSEMKSEMMINGIVSYSEYVAPKDEDL